MPLKHSQNTEQRPRRRWIWIPIAAACLLLALGISIAVFLLPALNSPETLFPEGAGEIAEMFPGIGGDGSRAMPDGVVNILLLGVENKKIEGASYQAVSPGDDAHTDVVIVAAVDFRNGTVDLISLPRDTFIVCDGIRGCYKLNAVINYGGGKYEEDGTAFLGLCAVASHLLDGLPVEYYFAVDYESVIGIVDAIGGVDYDMDMNYRATRSYTVGPTHLDGIGVLDYLRARSNAEGAHDDASRVVRQKKMLTAILRQVQQNGLISSLPSILSSVSGHTFTNLSLQQITALANFAGDVNTAEIGTYDFRGELTGAMPGSGAPDGWSFCFPYDDHRAEVMQTVYGFTPAPLSYCSYDFSVWLRWEGFYAWNALYNASLLSEWAEDAPLSGEASRALRDMEDAADSLRSAYHTAALSLSESDTLEMYDAVYELRSRTDEFSDLAGEPVSYSVGVRDDWWNDISINAVAVDFN